MHASTKNVQMYTHTHTCARYKNAASKPTDAIFFPQNSPTFNFNSDPTPGRRVNANCQFNLPGMYYAKRDLRADITFMYVCFCVCMHVYICVHTYMHVYVCMHTYIYAYMHA